MAKFISSKKYEGIQYYIKSNGYKTYYVRYKDEFNRLCRVKIGCETEGVTESYCKNKRIEIINAQNKGEQPPKIVKNRQKNLLTLNDVADKYFIAKKDQSSTYDRLGKYNKHLKPALGYKAITKISKSDLETLKLNIIEEKGLSKKTANFTMEMFSTIFNYGFKEELYESVNPASKVERYKINNTRERYLRVHEINELYKKVKAYDFENNFGNIFELFTKLAVTTGARTNGILTIKKSDIDLQSDIIRIIDHKNGGEVYSGYITDTTRELLTDHIKDLQYNDYILSINKENNEIISIRQIQTRLKPILDELFNTGIDVKDRKNRIVVHSLRHTFASQLAINDVPIRQIQELMNHKDIKQTMKYAKLQDEYNKKAAQSVF